MVWGKRSQVFRHPYNTLTCAYGQTVKSFKNCPGSVMLDRFRHFFS
jgi:hypothetical protein